MPSFHQWSFGLKFIFPLLCFLVRNNTFPFKKFPCPQGKTVGTSWGGHQQIPRWLQMVIRSSSELRLVALPNFGVWPSSCQEWLGVATPDLGFGQVSCRTLSYSLHVASSGIHETLGVYRLNWEDSICMLPPLWTQLFGKDHSIWLLTCVNPSCLPFVACRAVILSKPSLPPWRCIHYASCLLVGSCDVELSWDCL